MPEPEFMKYASQESASSLKIWVDKKIIFQKCLLREKKLKSYFFLLSIYLIPLHSAL